MEVYRIKDWDKHFEVAQSRRKADAKTTWVPFPNKHDGKCYRRIMRREDGPQIFAAWVLIVQVASKCPVRGVLSDEDGPLSAEDLELKTDCPAVIFKDALQLLASPDVGWLEAISDSEFRSALRAETDYRTGQTRQTGQDKKGCADVGVAESAPAKVPPFKCNGKVPEFVLSQAKLDEWQACYPSLNCLAEIRKARQWIEDNPSRRKTFGGMIRFLGNWLARTQNRSGGSTEIDRKEKYTERISLAEQDRRKRAEEDAAAKASWGEEQPPDLAKELAKKVKRP